MSSKPDGTKKASSYAVLEEAYLQKHLQDLKDTIAEAHGVIKDMGRERQEVQELRDEAKAALDEAKAVLGSASVVAGALVAEEIQTAVAKGMKEYNDALCTAIDLATHKVYKRFDTLAALLMGEDQPDKESLTVLVRKWRAEKGV